MSGALADAFDLIARRVNFTYTLYRAEGDVWGIKRPNGWTGMLGMVSRNEVDIALGPFTLTYGRWSEFKMSAPLYADNIEILTPVFEWRMALFNMITVFKYEVWILLFFTVILICLTMSVTDKCDNPNSKFQTRICKNLWNVTRTLLQKGCVQRPKSYSRAFLDTFWMINCLVLSLFFSGMVLTFLFLRRSPKIDSINDLIANRHMQPIVEFQSSVFSFFRDDDTDFFRPLFNRIMQNPSQCIMTYKNMSTIGMDLISTKSFSLITEGIGIRTFLFKRFKDGLPCNFRFAKQSLWPIRKVLAFRRTFQEEWIEKINDV
ncbi:hypothetical protein CDAR_412581 [Caerostris darwini]|uniref:Ionotropic receptor n=1 Tax=Caerostris darwini TaxID=1538125 RepID=A0AAV4QJL2_9ARAC|nr:hypothetical protein CDAR_412581 [Caerostris darwini]